MAKTGNKLPTTASRRTTRASANKENDRNGKNNPVEEDPASDSESDPETHEMTTAEDPKNIDGPIFDGEVFYIPKTIKKCRIAIVGVVEKCEELRIDNEALTLQVTELQQTLAKYQKNKKVQDEIKATVETKLFPHIKFITGKQLERKMAKLVYRAMRKAKGKTGEIDADHEARWLNTYSEDVTVSVNKIRQYSQERMRDSAMTFFKHHNYLPTALELRKCVTRDVDFTNDREAAIYAWYMTDLFRKSRIVSGKLPKIVFVFTNVPFTNAVLPSLLYRQGRLRQAVAKEAVV